MSEISTLPPQAFDGQVFVDAFRVKWVYDGSANYWRNVGQAPDIPVASEVQTGLLSAKLKQLLDSIPAGGGHFGIIAQPLLSLVPQNPNILHRDKILRARLTDSGTRIEGQSVQSRRYTPEQFVGKILIFKTGVLVKKAFLIFTNDEDAIYIEGDASAVGLNDDFEIIDSADLNPSGILIGDIMFVSDTIDITCVNGEGLPLNGNCNLDIIQCDNVANPPGLNFEISKDFLDSLCITVPGCKGPTGARGEKGKTGPDGTGDGPQGEQGDPGVNAPVVGSAFTGIKIIDIDDIFDTAVVSMELDAENGKLNIVRAKVRTPDSRTPATQLISTPINRSIQFKSDLSFDYELLKPTVDPINEVDAEILKYPQQYVRPQGAVATSKTIVNKVKLSEIINKVIAHYEQKLVQINNNYNQQLKTYIEGKDAAARTILAELAQKVADCEFELPIDFCLGIRPSDCKQIISSAQVPFEFPLAELIYSLPTDCTTVTATDLGLYTVPPSITPPEVPPPFIPDPPELPPFIQPPTFIQPPPNDPNLNSQITPDQISQGNMNIVPSTSTSPFINIMYPSNSTTSASPELPAGSYVIKYEGGSIRSSATDWQVGSPAIGEGLQAVASTSDGPTFVTSAPIPTSIDFNSMDKTSVESAHSNANFTEQVMVVDLPSPGRISLVAPMPGNVPQGDVKLRVFKANVPPGTTTLV